MIRKITLETETEPCSSMDSSMLMREKTKIKVYLQQIMNELGKQTIQQVVPGPKANDRAKTEPKHTREHCPMWTKPAEGCFPDPHGSGSAREGLGKPVEAMPSFHTLSYADVSAATDKNTRSWKSKEKEGYGSITFHLGKTMERKKIYLLYFL